jgi:tetratricopeptide (TPR) repeat protein
MAARLGDEELRGECMATRIVVLNDLDQHELRRAVADELIEIGERVGRTKLSLAGLVSRIDASLIVGDLDAAAADAARVEEALAREPDPPVQMQLAYSFPRRLLIEGRFDEAEAANERAYELRRSASLWWGGEESMFSVLFDIRREQGRLDEMLPWFSMGIGDERVLVANLHAQVLVEGGRHDEAREVLVPTGGIQRPVEDWYWIAEAVTAAELACELGDRDLGAELREQLRPFSGLLSCNGSITTGPPVDLHLGRLDLLLGDRQAARDHLSAALDLAVRIGAPSFEAQCALRLGLLLREDGDAEAAAPHLARADELAERHDLRRVRRLLGP